MPPKNESQTLVVVDQAPIAHTDPLARLDDLLRLNVADGDASPRTLRSYATHIGQFVAWCAEEGIDPGRAVYHDLLLYRRFLVEAEYTRATIGVKLSAISAIFRALVREGHRPDNPVDGIKPPRLATSRRDAILNLLYTPEEIVQIMAVIPEEPQAARCRDCGMVILAYGHGLRVSEVVGLDMAHIHLTAARPSLEVIGGKGGRDRVLYLVDRSIEALQDWLAHRTEIRRESYQDPDTGSLFLCLSNRNLGHRLTADGARHRLNQHARAAGLYRSGRSWHGLRHGHATEATRLGVDLLTLAEEMGHASVDTTRQYIQAARALDQNPAQVLDDV